MKTLTREHIRQLNMYGMYLDKPSIPLFQLKEFLTTEEPDYLNAIRGISHSPTNVVAASYFMRRWGMFISMQFYLLSSSNIVWDGADGDIVFGAVEEYGLRTIGTFVQEKDFRTVSEEEHEAVIQKILKEHCHLLISKIRQWCPVSPLILWENIFGYLIWHYHVFFSTADLSESAKKDWDMLCRDDVWKGIARTSRFRQYTNGKEPSQLLNSPVRKSCCFSKDVPGLMKCTFCPLHD